MLIVCITNIYADAHTLIILNTNISTTSFTFTKCLPLHAASPVDGKNSFTFAPLPPADLTAALDSCSDNLLKTSLEDFSVSPQHLAPAPAPKKDLLNNNTDYGCAGAGPVFSCGPGLGVADCHTPPPPPEPVPAPLLPLGSPYSSCQTPVSLLSHFDPDSSKASPQTFPLQPQYISL